MPVVESFRLFSFKSHWSFTFQIGYANESNTHPKWYQESHQPGWSKVTNSFPMLFGIDFCRYYHRLLETFSLMISFFQLFFLQSNQGKFRCGISTNTKFLRKKAHKTQCIRAHFQNWNDVDAELKTTFKDQTSQFNRPTDDSVSAQTQTNNTKNKFK